MLDSWPEDDRQMYRCQCDVCGEQGSPAQSASSATRGFHEFDQRVHLCGSCFVERGRPWVLWYDTSEVERRRQAMTEIITLRGDPHVDRLQTRDLLRAIRGRRLFGVCIVFFREGHTAPLDPALHQLPHDRQRPQLSQMITGARTQPEGGVTNLREDLGHIRESIMEALRVRLPDVDLRPGTMLRTLVDATTEQLGRTQQQIRDQIVSNAISSASGRQLLAQAMINPIRQRLDYQSAARRLFVVDPLPEGAVPVYDRDPNVTEPFTNVPNWPTWAVEDAMVYRRGSYEPFRVTAVTKDSLKLSEVEPDDDVLRLHFVYSQADDLDREWADVLPPTAWQRLMED